MNFLCAHCRFAWRGVSPACPRCSRLWHTIRWDTSSHD